MRFVFLGTGTSAGVPAIGCACTVCTSPDPRDRRLRTSAAVRFTDPAGHPRTILIDAGPDLREQALRHGLTRCDAILFTHNHVDHTFGLDEVRRFNAVMRAPISIYAEEHTLGHLRRVYAHIFDRDQNINDSFVATLVPHRVDIDRSFVLFGVRVTPIRLLHGRLPIVGYRFDVERGRGEDRVEGDRKNTEPPPPAGTPAPPPAGEEVFPLAYCTDVSAIPPESWRRLGGLRTLVLDALRERKHPTHFTLDEAVRAAEQIAASRTYFVHMAHDLPHAATNESLPEGMSLAHDGLELG